MNRAELVNVLKKVRNIKMHEDIDIVCINNNRELIEEGISFDDEHTCYHSYKSLEDMITSLMVSNATYGIFYKGEYIGIISVFYHHYKDLSRLELSISIKKEYRNSGIGKFCYNVIIDGYFKDETIKSIHLSIREDNIKSRMLAEKCGFKLYIGYKYDKYFKDLDGNKIPQVQYLLKKKDYIKK